MKRLLSLAVLGVIGFTSSHVFSAPVKMSKAQMDQAVAGVSSKWTYNAPGSGKETSGHGKGLDLTNPGGNAPPGQNK